MRISTRRRIGLIPSAAASQTQTLSGGARVLDNARAASPDRTRIWLQRAGIAAIASSIVLIITVGIARPPAELAAFPATPPWPPWFIHLPVNPLAASTLSYLFVLLGTAGVVTGLLAVRRGWLPTPRLIIAGAVVAAVALAVIPPVTNGDMLYYASFGRITTIGHNPYSPAPQRYLPASDPVREAVSSYHNDVPSLYGSAATAADALASGLAGDSELRTLFWLKVWAALGFLAVVLMLDLVTRRDPGRRARAHLLWSVNPLMLLLMVGAGHNDVLAAAAGTAAVLTLRHLDRKRGALAGVLTGAAIAVKASLGVFGLGLLWTARRSLRVGVAIALGIVLALVPGYLVFGPKELAVTTLGLASYETPNLLWQHLAAAAGWQPHFTNVAATVICAVLAAILLWRLPTGPPDVPAVRTVLALAFALLAVSPLQRACYDAMAFPLIALMPVSRLDWIVLIRNAALTVGSVPSAYSLLHPSAISWIERVGSDVLVTGGICVAGIILLVLCATGKWHARGREVADCAYETAARLTA